MPTEKLPHHVISYIHNDPTVTSGGVETFARNLEHIFERVEHVTRRNRDVDYVERYHLPVICDNQLVTDWPESVPLIGFQHGVAAVKVRRTKKPGHWLMARGQRRAARRPNTVWAANAEWVAATSRELYGSPVKHVVYNPTDMERFDGLLTGDQPRLILHDARKRHKGSALMKTIERAYPNWEFRLLPGPNPVVQDQMRHARAFMHLSLYEGNSLVCNEAMAMDLPCLFTRVGLMQDSGGPTEVYLVDPDEVYGSRAMLVEEVGKFLESLETRAYNPRQWVLDHGTLDISRAKWREVMDDFEEMSGWRVEGERRAAGQIAPPRRA